MMRMPLGYRLRAYLEIVRTAAIRRLAYRGEALGRGLFFVLIVFVFSRIWRMLPLGGDLGPFDAGSLVWYVVFTEAIVLSAPRIEEQVQEEVQSGALGYLLCRPISYVGYHLAAFWGEALVRLVVNLVMGGGLAWWMVGPPPAGAVSLGLGVITALLGFLLHFYLSLSMALMSFWIEDVRPFFWIYQKMLFTLGGLMIPLDLFPEAIRAVASCLPFAYQLYAPARTLLAGDAWVPVLPILAGQAAWLAATILAAHLLFLAGSRRVAVQGG